MRLNSHAGWLSFFFFKFSFVCLCVCVCACACWCTLVHVYLSEDSFMGVSSLGIFLSLIKACHELRNSMLVE